MLGVAGLVDEIEEIEEVEEVEAFDELDELDELNEPYKPGGKTLWLDGPSTIASALGFVVINGWGWGWGWFWLPVELGGLAVGTDNKLGKFLSVKLRSDFDFMIVGNKLIGMSVKRTYRSVDS